MQSRSNDDRMEVNSVTDGDCNDDDEGWSEMVICTICGTYVWTAMLPVLVLNQAYKNYLEDIKYI